MSWRRQQWSPEAADDWGGEDVIASLLSAISYLLLIVGSALSLLAEPIGYALLIAGLAATAAMYYLIDPKLRAVSADYEKKQKEHLERLEQITRWEHRE